MEKISFFDILLESWRLSVAQKRFFVFGFLLALPIASQSFLPLSEGPLNTDSVTHLLITFPLATFAWISFYFFSNVFGRGSLITLLSSTLHHAQPKQTVTTSYIWKNAKKTFFLDSLFGIFLVLLIVFLSTPSLISLFLFGHISEVLIFLGSLVFFFVGIFVFFIYTFSLFYFLLSPLKILSAIERGYALFYQYRLQSLLFGLFVISLSIIFTFCLNLVMLGGVVLFQGISHSIPESFIAFVLSLCFFTWFTIFSQALWLHFFVRLATPKNITPEKIVEVVLKESVPEAPIG